MSDELTFFLNGKAVSIENPSPDLLLIDYLRSPGVGLAGPKKPCGQGGCGGCTVILSSWDGDNNKPRHRAINSCLRPVCALGGLVVTTVEGTGGARKPDAQFLLHAYTASRSAAPIGRDDSPVLRNASAAVNEKRKFVDDAVTTKRVSDAVTPNHELNANLENVISSVAENPSEHSHAGMNPVAHRLALNNGSQCGYCSVGFVMNMSEFIVNNPVATKAEIEAAFDGNLCRCTGYRSILTGMKTFASDWDEEDENNRMKCLEDDDCAAQLPAFVTIPFPLAARDAAKPISSKGNRQKWFTPTSEAEFADILHKNRDRKIRLVHGNTSYGIYEDEYLDTQIFVDIRLIVGLNTSGAVINDKLVVPAGTSYSDFIDLATRVMKEHNLNASTSVIGAMHFMARRTAGRIVRNAASLGGNLMLVFKHIEKGTGEPFPSDLFTTLVAVGAELSYLILNPNGAFTAHKMPSDDLIRAVQNDSSLVDRIVITSLELSLGSVKEVVLAQKVALRESNSHSIVNATTHFTFADGDGVTVASASFVFGGIAPFPWHAANTENAIAGGKLTLATVPLLSEILAAEVENELKRWEDRMQEVPNHGFTNEYRARLTTAFFFKAVVHALMSRGENVPENVRSCGQVQWGNWGVSDGTQKYKPQMYKAPVAQPYIKSGAMYQTSGQIHYTHELAVPPLTAHGAFVQSQRALRNYFFVIPERSENAVDVPILREHLKTVYSSFIDLITHHNIKNGGINLMGMGKDQPLFAEKLVSYVGQSIALVLAATETEAIRIADYVSKRCVDYLAPGAPWLGQWSEPIIDLLDAIEKGSVFPDAPKAVSFVSHIWKIIRPGSQLDWAKETEATNGTIVDRTIVLREKVPVGPAKCTVVKSSQLCGGQAHFYMEPQACIAIPGDGGRICIRPSTQSPAEVHSATAMALGLQYHQVEVDVAPVGGGFGGKTEQSVFIAGATAVAAKATKRPVRVAVPRDDDTAMVGKRHAYFGQYQIAVGTGEGKFDDNSDDKGIIYGLQLKMWGDGGAFYDCSFIVSNCIQLRADNAYRIANFESQIDVCRTNKAPSTAMRAFGDIQCKNILESAIDDAAVALGMRPETLREKNLYDRGDVTPFGQALSYCYMKQVWDYVRRVSDYENKCHAVDTFNKANKWRKQGIAIIPVKYGSGYNLLQLEQSTAIVLVNPSDGTIVIHQAGVEMGQGLVTQARQVAAYVLGLPMAMMFIDSVNTSVTPNPTSTGGSTGTPYSCEAVKQACQQLRARLMEFGYQMLKDVGDAKCKDLGIDFWNYGAAEDGGWATTVDNSYGTKAMIWQFLIQVAHAKRLNLVASVNAKMKGGEVQVPAMTFKSERDQPNLPGIERIRNATLGGGVDSFHGFTYSAACSMVEIDVLTGEVTILSSDIVYDIGWSMNPAIDIGQIEGAFVQGIGYLLTERLVFEPEGDAKGRLNATNTWGYKIPATTTIPLRMNTYLFPRDHESVKSIPEDSNDIFSAKEVGEPPLVLANSVFFAVKAAIRASRIERNLDPHFQLDAPATVQEVRRACEVTNMDSE